MAALLIAAVACRERGPRRPSPASAGAPADGLALVYDQVVAGNQDLYVIPAAGGVPRRLTDHPGHDMLPRFTRGGASVLFASDRGGVWQIWEVAAEGGEARRVRSTTAIEWQVDESDDGRTLAFLSKVEGPEYLFVQPRSGGEARALVRHGRDTIMGNPDWSPDASRITFSSNWRIGHHIYVVDVASAKVVRISPLHRGGCEPRFSPDGRKVAYVDRGHLGDTSTIVEVDVDSGERKTLVDWPSMNYDPAYAPDGSEIAFASNVTGEYAIYRQRLSDGKSWRVTHTRGDARYPDYSPAR